MPDPDDDRRAAEEAARRAEEAADRAEKVAKELEQRDAARGGEGQGGKTEE